MSCRLTRTDAVPSGQLAFAREGADLAIFVPFRGCRRPRDKPARHRGRPESHLAAGDWAFRGRNFIGNFDRLRNCQVGLVHNAGLRHCRTSRRRAPLGHSPMTRSSTPRRAKGPAHQDTGERIPQPPRSRDRPERSALRKAERTRRAEAWPAMDSAGAVIGPVVHSLSYCSRRCIQSLAANPLR